MIYVLVPAHDEAPTVGLLLWKVRQLFADFPREYQLIVVNDGSADSSDEVLARYERALPMTLVTHRRREGYGRSLEQLLRLALQHTDRPRRDMAVTLQADFSDPVDALPELIKRIEGGADIAVADRRRAAGGPGERWARRVLPALARMAVRVPGADDLVGTMRVYRLAVIERLAREAGDGPFLTRDGWSADLELLVRAARHARKVESVPVAAPRLEGARASRRRHLRDAWQALRTAFALRALPPAPRFTDRPDAERAPQDRPPRQERPRHERAERERPARQDRQERQERPERQGRPERRSRGERKRQKEQRQPRHDRPAEERPAATAAAAAAAVTVQPVAEPSPEQRPAGEGRRRRRRGRGRRGRRGAGGGEAGGGAPQDTAPAPTPGPDAA